MAASFHARFPYRFELDDLVQIGELALMGAAARYQPERRVPFQTYARHRVRGAMLDALGGCVPEPCGGGEELADPATPDLDEGIDLRRAIEDLPPRQASVIKLRYVDGLTQSVAGERLGGISQAAAGGLEQRALSTLRSVLRPAA